MMRFKKALISAAAVGTLALAGGAWTPAAMAQTTAVIAPTSARPGTVKACNSSTKNWAATYPTFGEWLDGYGATHCIGNKGTFSVPQNETQVFCAGNNTGTFWFHDYSTGTNGSGNFRYDNSYEVVEGEVKGAYLPDSDLINVTKVKITSWTGSAGC